MNKFYNTLKTITPILIAALLLSAVITVQLPIEIYLNNADEFNLSLYQLFYTFGIAFIITFLVFFLPAFVPYHSFRQHYFAWLATLALLMWFTAHFLFGSYGAFDGRGLTIDKFSISAIAEALLWIGALTTALIFAKKIHPYLLQTTGGVFLIVVAITGYEVTHYLLTEDKLLPANLNENQNHLTDEYLTFSTQSNILHIVLDEQQSTVIEYLIETNSLFRQNLTGFIFFPNTTANYRSTVMAIPAMLTGKVYANKGDKNQFLQDILSNNPFITTLQNAHYSTAVYTMSFYCNKKIIDNCIPQPELSAELSAILLLDYSLFKAAPDILKPFLYRADRWIIQKYFVNPNYKTTLAGLSHLAFEYFNENLLIKDIPPTYKFYHSMITHSPAVLEEDCQLRLTRISRHALEGKATQTTCAFKHIFAFIEKLKQAGIYDQTLIIISSDHGSNYLSPEQKNNLTQNTIDERHYTTALATLLIKPFNAHGLLQTSNAPARLSDIPNTILASLEQPLLPDGENILALSAQQERPRDFIFYEMDTTFWETSKLPPLTIYTIIGDVRNINDWQLKCSDVGEENTNCSNVNSR